MQVWSGPSFLVPQLYETKYSEHHSLLVCEFPVVRLKFIDVSEQTAPVIYNSICPEDRYSSSLRHLVFPGMPSTGEKKILKGISLQMFKISSPST